MKLLILFLISTGAFAQKIDLSTLGTKLRSAETGLWQCQQACDTKYTPYIKSIRDLKISRETLSTTADTEFTAKENELRTIEANISK